jgi:hypothetical protein
MAKMNAVEKARKAREDGALPTFDGVDDRYYPTISQHQRWWSFIIPELGVDPDGAWYGFCPLHDEKRNKKHPTAMFSFGSRSYIRCLSDAGCHPGKRGISLTNAYEQMFASAAHGE